MAEQCDVDVMVEIGPQARAGALEQRFDAGVAEITVQFTMECNGVGEPRHFSHCETVGERSGQRNAVFIDVTIDSSTDDRAVPKSNARRFERFSALREIRASHGHRRPKGVDRGEAEVIRWRMVEHSKHSRRKQIYEKIPALFRKISYAGIGSDRQARSNCIWVIEVFVRERYFSEF